MKLAEALQIRADLQRRIAQMPMRLANNAKVQEGSARICRASDLTPRHTLTEIRVVSTVDVAALRKECDALSKQLRELEIRIQSLNWTIELD